MRVGLILILLCSVSFAAGCSQGVGDRCVQNSDCSTGMCSITGVTGANQVMGKCLPYPTATTATGGSTGEAGQGGAAGEGGAAGQDGGGGQAGASSDAAPMTDAAPPTDGATSPTDAQVD
jgi:hypothetical protein